jgi:DNA-binding MarR family transcriptional regulator
MLDIQTQAKRKEAADQFLESIPPIWYSLHSQIDKFAREKFDITAGQFHVLQRIKSGKTSVSDLADARHISRPTVSRKIDNLVEKGLVSRKESREDRRFTILELTEEGEKILQMMASSRRVWLEEQLGSLDDKELEIIIQAFSILGKLQK